MRVFRVLIVAALLLTPSAAVYSQENGPADDPRVGSRPALPVDGSWNVFSWSSGVGSLNNEGPFTFTGPAVLDVTDAFLDGDRFEVLDGATSLGTTSVPTDTGSFILDPDTAFADPDWSSGTFVLGPGPHSITLRTIATATGFVGGGAFLRVTASVPVAPPWMLALLATAIVAAGAWMLRRFGSRSDDLATSP